MTKPERIAIAEKICKLYETDQHTIGSCCEANGIDYSTLSLWVNRESKHYIQQIQELYKKAQDTKRKANNCKLVKLARTALEKKLSFWEYVEKTTETTETPTGTITKYKEVNKFIIPTATDIAIALNNLDSDFDPQVIPLTSKDDLIAIAEAIRNSDTK